MINEFQFDEYVSVLSSIISYGINHKYNPSFIESRISGSKYIKALEKNDDLIIKAPHIDILKDIYPDYIEDDNGLISNQAYWISEIYLMIFFRYQKSFSYIFLYAPIEYLLNSYSVYHEQDTENIINEYLDLTKEPLLNKLLCTLDIQMKKLSLATSISYDTIVKYCQNNAYLYKASFNNIIKISTYLSVDINMFIEKLLISTNKRNDKAFMVYYSYLTACLYKNEYKVDDFIFDYENNYYLDNNNNKVYIRITDDLPNTFSDQRIVESLNLLLLKTIDMNATSNDSLIIYEQNLPPKIKSYLSLDVSKYKNAIVITYMAIYNLKNGKTIRIRDNDDRFIKESANEYSLAQSK